MNQHSELQCPSDVKLSDLASIEGRIVMFMQISVRLFKPYRVARIHLTIGKAKQSLSFVLKAEKDGDELNQMRKEGSFNTS